MLDTFRYADWVMGQMDFYRKEGIRRLIAGTAHDDFVIDLSGMESLKASKWKLAVNLVVSTQNLESSLHAVERVKSEGRGRPPQFIPIRFVFSNKITRDDKLLMAFDAVVLSEMLGREISLGRIIHGDSHFKLKVKTEAALQCAKKISAVRKIISRSAADNTSYKESGTVYIKSC